MENKTKNRTLTKVLIALIVVLLTAPSLFARANPGKKMKPNWPAKKTKQAKKQVKLTKEKINNILDRIEQNQPERAKQLRRLRKKNPEKFRTELRKVMQKWASKKDRRPESSARRGKGQGLRGKEQGLRGRGQGLRGKEQGLRGRGQGLRGRGQGLRGKEQGLRGRGQGLRGKEQGLRGRGQGCRQGMGFDHGRRGQGRRQGMGFDHWRRGQGRCQGMGFGHGQGRKFRGSRRWKNHPQW